MLFRIKFHQLFIRFSISEIEVIEEVTIRVWSRMSSDETEKKTSGYLRLEDWLQSAEEELKEHLDKETVVVSLIGKDSVDRGKGEDINDLIKNGVFPSYTPIHETLSILTYYSPQHNALFLVLNGIEDNTNLVKVFATRLRLKQLGRNEDNPMFDRLTCPLLLFGFHRNNIRKFLGNAKKREIYEKLEQSMENQIHAILKAYQLIEAPSDQSLAALDEVTPFVHLISPSATLYNPLDEILSLVMSDDFSLETPTTVNSGISFRQFFTRNINSFFNNAENESKRIPTLKELIDRYKSNASLRTKVFYQENEAIKNIFTLHTNRELQFLNWLTDKQIDDAVEKYSNADSAKERDRQVFTRAEHDQKFSLAVNYLDNVIVGDRAQAMIKLRNKCDQLWQGGMRGCEQLSLTGEPCQLPAHSTIGDASVPESEWTNHRSNKTFISTCPCGRTQAVRQDPFTLYEANYLFYSTSFFPCCKQLEKYSFNVVADDDNEGEAQGEEWSNWFGKSNSFVDENEENSDAAMEKDMDEMKIKDDSSSDSSFLDDSLPVSDSSDRMTSSRADDEFGTSTRRRPTVNQEEFRRLTPSTSSGVPTEETTNSTKESLISSVKRISRLRNNKVEFLEGVPHTLSPQIPPLFPSWVLTCIGSGRLYSHSHGLRDHPNFKQFSESLLPVDVHLQIDVNQWERDMQYVQAMESTSQAGLNERSRRMPRRNMQFDTERVKLFIGFDYECPRGHRFFATSTGEPLILPKTPASTRESMIKEAAEGLLDADLPLRRECTCRRKPLQIAQLMRIHVVTPKAPVEVTIQPVIEIEDQPGQFITGEPPLKLKWARYYILQLPFVYSGPNGAWLPPDTLQNVGTYKAGSIRVNYVPLIHIHCSPMEAIVELALRLPPTRAPVTVPICLHTSRIFSGDGCFEELLIFLQESSPIL
ncbi:hypothetical protein WR25_17679 [Diploscapter pachys]|uniref:Nonsense-mediated mRNA decay factor SMG8 n=1 Tax=Diploscapter pachys TaxID=2018661 RepID=A0A2A2KBV5_9BILA|nr:hypothetical protein WR25_17679 [Diploscapter pachys]